MMDLSLGPLKTSFLVLLILASFFSVIIEAKADASPLSEISDAEIALESAFSAVLEAENAGANVSLLVDRLSVGADLIAQARMDYRIGDVMGVKDIIGNVHAIAYDVESDALLPKALASYGNQINTETILIVCSLSIFFYIIALFAIWAWFKSNYYKKLLSSKLEAKTNDT